MNAAPFANCPMKAHRAPDPAPIEEPAPDPFDTPHPHHQPGHPHLPQGEEEPVPDPKPSLFSWGISRFDFTQPARMPKAKNRMAGSRKLFMCSDSTEGPAS